MGDIRIKVGGSFDRREEKVFSAIDHGHADAVAKAIEFLSTKVLPRAIKLDHKLQAAGDAPGVEFGRDT